MRKPSARIPIAKEGFPFLLPLLGLAGGSVILGWPWAAAFFAALAVGVGFFFRDPEREGPKEEGLILAPADGKVVAIEPYQGASGEELIQVSIFLALWNVHINRAPITSVVQEIRYRPGRFKVAFKPEASSQNEQNLIRFASPWGEIRVKQIAGFLARRIVCWLKSGQKVEAGERIGLIRFGSRVDILIPRQVELRIKVGDRVKGSLDVIGHFHGRPETGDLDVRCSMIEHPTSNIER